MEEYFSGDQVIHRFVSSTPSDYQDSAEPADAPAKPKMSIKKDDGCVIIKFDQKSDLPLRIFSKRGSEENFSLLAEISGNQYPDNRPNTFNAPELREYMACYVKNDVQIGPASDVVLIIKK